MSDLIKFLGKDVSTRYAKSLSQYQDHSRVVIPISARDQILLAKASTRERIFNEHKVKIDRQIVLGAQPSPAPLFIRYYLGLGIDIIGEIISDWGQHAMSGMGLEDLGRFALGQMSLAQPVIQLGFYCAAKEIDPLRAYESEYKYKCPAHAHLMYCVSVAYGCDKKKRANGVSSHASFSRYESTFREVALLYAENSIEFLTKARDDLSGKSCQIPLSC